MAQKASVSAAEVEIEEKVDLAPLSSLINATLFLRVPPPQSVFTDERLLALCEAYSIFSQCGLAENVTCRECEEPHTAAVVLDRGRFFYRCLFNGRVDLKEEDLRLFAFDRDALLYALAAAASLPTRGIIFHADRRLVRLGFVDDQERKWIIGYADGLDNSNSLAGVTEALEKQFSDGPGLIVTPSPINLNLPLPRLYRLIALHELFFGEANRIVLDWTAAWTWLGRRKRVPGIPGRPTVLEKTRKLRTKLQSAEKWPSERSAQVKLVLQQWSNEDMPKPACKTIENHLRVLEAEERTSKSL